MAASPAGRFAVFVVKADHVQDGTATSPIRREISVSLALGPRAAAIIFGSSNHLAERPRMPVYYVIALNRSCTSDFSYQRTTAEVSKLLQEHDGRRCSTHGLREVSLSNFLPLPFGSYIKLRSGSSLPEFTTQPR